MTDKLARITIAIPVTDDRLDARVVPVLTVDTAGLSEHYVKVTQSLADAIMEFVQWIGTGNLPDKLVPTISRLLEQPDVMDKLIAWKMAQQMSALSELMDVINELSKTMDYHADTSDQEVDMPQSFKDFFGKLDIDKLLDEDGSDG